MERQLKKLHNSEKGQALILVALILTVLLGFAAISIDYGMLSLEKRNLQNMADAAALSGAMVVNDTLDITTETAVNYAKLNGLKSDTNKVKKNGDLIEVDIIAPDKVKVVVSREVKNSFSKVFGIKSSIVSAKAVAVNTNEEATVQNTYKVALFSEKDMKFEGINNIEVKGKTHSNEDIEIERIQKGLFRDDFHAKGEIKQREYDSSVIDYQGEKAGSQKYLEQEFLTQPLKPTIYIDDISSEPENFYDKDIVLDSTSTYSSIEAKKDVTIKGNSEIIIDGFLIVEGDLKVINSGSLKVLGDVQINGKLIVSGVARFNATGSVRVKNQIEVKGSSELKVDGPIITDKKIEVEGGRTQFTAFKVKAKDLVVRGSAIFDIKDDVVVTDDIELQGGRTSFSAIGSVYCEKFQQSGSSVFSTNESVVASKEVSVSGGSTKFFAKKIVFTEELNVFNSAYFETEGPVLSLDDITVDNYGGSFISGPVLSSEKIKFRGGSYIIDNSKSGNIGSPGVSFKSSRLVE